MRQTLEQLGEAAEFMAQIDSLSQGKRDHLRVVVKLIMRCYTDPKVHGVILIDNEDSDKTEMLAINADEMETAALLGIASAAMTNELMADMPEKGMLN